jgi:alpha-N-arabinofuranosidase
MVPHVARQAKVRNVPLTISQLRSHRSPCWSSVSAVERADTDSTDCTDRGLRVPSNLCNPLAAPSRRRLCNNGALLLCRQSRRRYDRYLARAAHFESYVDTLAATLRYVKSKQRSQHDVYLSWDEWNVWYKNQEMDGNWTQAPHLIEEVYNLEDALVVAQWLNVFLRKCDVIKIACLAQIVNVIAPILTTRDSLVKQTIFYPIKLASKFARGQALAVATRAPAISTKRFGDMPALDAAASYDPATGQSAVFVVNRSQTDALPTEIIWQSETPREIAGVYQLAGSDVKAINSFEQPDTIVARQIAGGRMDGNKLCLQLPPLSFTVISAA